MVVFAQTDVRGNYRKTAIQHLTVQKILTILFTIGTVILLVSCGNNFEKDSYERITNIKFPDHYKLVGTADNKEFITITILDLGRDDCNKFMKANNFEPMADQCLPLVQKWISDLNLPLPEDRSQLLSRCGNDDKYRWTYLLDTAACRLFCQIKYPGMGQLGQP